MARFGRQVSRVLLPCLLLLAGCSQSSDVEEDPPIIKNLYAVSQAYGLILGTTQKPPASMEQLSTTLAELHTAGLGPVPEEVLKSPRDGLPFVVVLGVQPNPDAKGEIFIYEQNGVDGQRYVMTLSNDIYLKSDEDFAQASFAKGHRPAKS